jgi:hypothetical protein
VENTLTGPNRESQGRSLLFFALALALLAVVPASLMVKESLERNRTASTLRGPATTMVETIIDGYQKSALFIGAALAFLSFRKLVPVIWPLFQSSLAGLLIAAEIAVVFWLVYGGMARVGMPRLFWAPHEWTMLRSAVGVTLFIYWMLYLVFARDFEVHSHEPSRQVWIRFRRVLAESGLPALFGQDLDRVHGATQIRWLLGYSGLPALLALAVPALIPAVRPAGSRALIEWPWLAGMAIGVGVVALAVWTRVATRLHELLRQLLSRRIDLRQIRELDPNRLDPHANMKNILVIVVMIQAISYLDFYSVERWMMSLFPPAFSICVMLGVVATIATYLGTRSRTTRAVVVCALLFVLAIAGMLDYEVEISSLADWYPTPGQQLVRQIVPAAAPRYPGTGVTDLEVFQRGTSPATSRESHQAREKLLDRWAASFQAPGLADPKARKPILVVVATSGGALRAAIWTEVVLGHLDARLDDFHHHVRLITGASGGMLGAARYVTARCYGTLMPEERTNAGPPPDYLTPIAWQMAFRDFFPNCLFPWPTHNRGDALEEAWIKRDCAIAHSFSDIRPNEEAGLIPSLIFSPMLVEDGRRVLISNLPLHDLAVIDAEALLTEDSEVLRQRLRTQDPTIAQNGPPHSYDLEYPELASVPAVEFFRLFGESSREKLTLANAVRMSATFPYITSSVCLPTDPPRHVVDAGYYDNFGVNLTAAWIASHRKWITAHTGGVLVIQARAFRNEKQIKVLSEQIQPEPTTDETSNWEQNVVERAVGFTPWLAGSILNGVQSVVMPIEGLAKARDSSMYFRNDEELRALKHIFAELTNDEEFFRSVIFTCDTIQSEKRTQNVETLNWCIDPEEFEQIRHNIEPLNHMANRGRDRNDMRFKNLAKWWCSRGGRMKAGGLALLTAQ